jgi:hypothetical protein
MPLIGALIQRIDDNDREVIEMRCGLAEWLNYETIKTNANVLTRPTKIVV